MNYLKGSAVIENLTVSKYSKDDSTMLWQMRLGQVSLNSLKALAKQELFESASTFKMKIGGYDVLDKKTKVKLGTTTLHDEGLLDCVHIDILGPAKTASFGVHRYFVSFFDYLSKGCWVYPLR